MAQKIQEGVSTNNDVYETAPNANMTEEQRALKATEAEKTEAERQDKWALRADVVYHFFAYRYFDRSAICLDLLNFSDADIDSFNLTANKTRGLNNWHVCAQYLKKLTNPTPKTDTHRRRLIHKVRTFNKTQAAHFRFHLSNLNEDDIAYVQALCNEERATTNNRAIKDMKLIWATSCVADEVPRGLKGYDDSDAIDSVQVAIENCLNDHHQKLRDMVSESTAKKAQDHAEKIEVICDE